MHPLSRRVKWRRLNIKFIRGPAVLHLPPWSHRDGKQGVRGPPAHRGPSFHRQIPSSTPTSLIFSRPPIGVSRAQAVTTSSSSREASALDKCPFSSLALTALLLSLGSLQWERRSWVYLGPSPYCGFFPNHQQCCAYRLGSWCSSCQLLSTARVNTGRCWLFPGCSIKLLTLSLKKNIFWD